MQTKCEVVDGRDRVEIAYIDASGSPRHAESVQLPGCMVMC